jgi:hypothetical protein
MERGIDGTSVYLIRISYLENNVLDLCSSGFILLSPQFYSLSATLIICSCPDDDIVMVF